MIDIHIGLMPEETFTPPRIPGLTFHTVQATEGHIGRTRRLGFQQGNHEFCTFIDADDTCHFAVIEELQMQLKRCPDAAAIVSKETIHGVDCKPPMPSHGGTFTLSQILNAHHLVIYRREKLIPYLDLLLQFNNAPEFCLNGIMVNYKEKFIYSEKCAYDWKPQLSGARLRITPNAATQKCLLFLAGKAKEDTHV